MDIPINYIIKAHVYIFYILPYVTSTPPDVSSTKNDKSPPLIGEKSYQAILAYPNGFKVLLL